MRVNCDVCGGEPATVVCCADEAALCSACDRRVHGANKLAGKHRRIPLLHPAGGDDDSSTTAPLCDVCKERRGLVFCVEDRAILCADCDDPIHSSNDLTAKHTRFLLVGAKLSSAVIVDQEQEQEPSSPLDSGGESDGVPAAASSVQQDTSTDKSDNNDNGGGAMISDYLTNICPGWRVDDLLLDEHVPSMDADLFDVVAAGRQEKKENCGAPSWTGTGGELRFDEVPTATQQTAKLGRARETTAYWNTIDSDSDVFAVPEITSPPAKKARPSPAFWCF